MNQKLMIENLKELSSELWKRAADVAPIVHGHWLTWDEKFPGRSTTLKCHYGCYCSVCGNYANHATTYCPNCGAKMEDEDDGKTIY